MATQLVPSGTSRLEHRVSNSRFIATVGRVASVEEAKAFIHAIREEMPDATHHVYAFRVGHGQNVIDGMSDDGEPSGTSGPPVLAVVRGQKELGDVAVVITRYFGGTKLGTGGLVSAYGETAKLALAEAVLEEKIDRVLVEIDVPYSLHDGLKRLFEEHGVLLEKEEFGAQVSLRLQVPVGELEALREKVRDLSGGQVGI